MTCRKIKEEDIRQAVKDLSLRANLVLREDIFDELEECYQREKEGTQAKNMLEVLIENVRIAEEKKIPLCQDTGMAVVFLDIGKDIDLCETDIVRAVNNGVNDAYMEGCFRKSVVNDPLTRQNTGTNTPAVIHVDFVCGDKIKISVMPKGFGAENKSRLTMMNPTASSGEIMDFCVETVKIAGPDACPPYFLGIGIGGTMDMCAMLAKKALLRPISSQNPKEHIAELERKIKEKANALGIGIMGLKGNSTCLGVNIETGPTHIAGLPVAVNVSCHALRSASDTI